MKALALLAVVTAAAGYQQGQDCVTAECVRCGTMRAWNTVNGHCPCPGRGYKRSAPQGIFCWPACPPAFRTSNILTWVGSAFGALGIVGCICVMWVIYGYGKDRRSIRDRILIGIFMSNLVYSIANAAPNNLVGEATGRPCGHWVIDPVPGEYKATCSLRGLWMWGKYSMVCFELLAVYVSVKGLRTGATSLSERHEFIAHVTCALAGLIAFSVYFSECKVNNALSSNLTLADDDDDSPAELANYESYNSNQTVLYQRMMSFWFIPTGLCLLLWLYQLRLFRAFDADWKAAAVETREQMDRDLWNVRDPHVVGQRDNKEKLLRLQRESYVDVVAFLEPYMAVFFLFTVPAITMVTDKCQESSFAFQNLQWWNPTLDQQDVPVSCNIVCEMVLSVRSIAMVAVYFWDLDHRRELYDVVTLACRTGARLSFFGKWARAKVLGKPPPSNTSGRAQFKLGSDLESKRTLSIRSDFTTSTFTDRQSLLSATLDSRHAASPVDPADGMTYADPTPGDGTSSSLPYQRMEDDRDPE